MSKNDDECKRHDDDDVDLDDVNDDDDDDDDVHCSSSSCSITQLQQLSTFRLKFEAKRGSWRLLCHYSESPYLELALTVNFLQVKVAGVILG